MPDGQGTSLTPAQQFEQQLNSQVQNFKALLPSHIPVERFKRTVVVAVSQNPDLFYADRRSFFNAAQKCASDGLMPDGREAALVVFNTRTKVRLPDGTNEERNVPLVQYFPMIAGVRKRMRNSGDVISAEAHVVYTNDHFEQEFGDEGRIVHKPPPLGQPRGAPVGAYAIVKLKNGEVLREIMDYSEIERVRSFSRAKDGPAWKNWWAEMARKSVLRRCAKAAPNSAELEELMQRDEEEPEEPNYVDMPSMEPEPSRQIGNGNGEPAQDLYTLTDADGVDHDYTEPTSVEKALDLIFADAKSRGRVALTEAAENNRETLAQLRQRGHAAIVDGLEERYSRMLAELSPFGQKPTAQPEDPGLPQLKSYDDGKPRWPEFAHDMILAMRDAADRDRLARLWQHAEPQLQKAPQTVRRDIERAHAERLQAHAGEPVA